jgi:hypothetical protein
LLAQLKYNMKKIISILCLFITFQVMAQQKPAQKKPKNTTNQQSKPKKPKVVTKIDTKLDKSALTPEQKLMLTKIAYDAYVSQNDVKPSLLENQMVMEDVIIPNSITPSGTDIQNGIAQFKKTLHATSSKATSFVTVDGVPQNNAYWVTINADIKSLPYFQYVDYNAKWNYVKNEKGQNVMTMGESDQNKENALVAKTLKTQYGYNIIVNYKPLDLNLKEVSGEIEVTVPKKFEVIELKKTDLNKDFVLGKTKIKLLRFFTKNYAIKFENDDPSIKMVIISDTKKQFVNHNVSYVSPKQFEKFSKTKKINDDTLTTLAATIDDISDVNRVKMGKVQGNGTIQKILLFRAIETEKVAVKVDLFAIETKEVLTEKK